MILLILGVVHQVTMADSIESLYFHDKTLSQLTLSELQKVS